MKFTAFHLQLVLSAVVLLCSTKSVFGFVAVNAPRNSHGASTTNSLSSTTTTLYADSSSFEEMMNSAKEAFSDAASDVTGALTEATSSAAAGGGDSSSDVADLLTSLPPEAAIAVGVVAVLGIGAATLGSGSSSDSSGPTSSAGQGGKKKTPRKKSNGPDLSIPYNAAAQLAYESWLSKQKEGTPDTEEAFEQFKVMYEKAAVMKATAKKLEQDLENFDPNKPKPPPRQISIPEPEPNGAATEKAKELFFAQ